MNKNNRWRVGMIVSGGLLGAAVGFNLISPIWLNPAPVEEVVQDDRFSPPAEGYTCHEFNEVLYTPGGAVYLFDTLFHVYSNVMEKATLGGASAASIDFTECMVENSRYVVEFTSRACGHCYSKAQDSTNQFAKVKDRVLDTVMDYCESGSDLDFYDWISDKYTPKAPGRKAPRRKGSGEICGRLKFSCQKLAAF